MRAWRSPRVKICCIASVEEARLAIEHGAAAIGLVSEMPSGPGVIPEPLIAAIAARVPPGVASVLLTARQDPEAIIEQQRRTRVNTLQLCDAVDPRSYAELRDALPGISLIQVIHVAGPGAFARAETAALHVDALLLDSGRPDLPVKELGGTGRVHDWQTSRAIRARVEIPVFLAGGLTPELVPAAINEVGPFGLDVCTGVRTEGRLDSEKLQRFMAAVAAAS